MNDENLINLLGLAGDNGNAESFTYFNAWDRDRKDLLISLIESAHQAGFDIFRTGHERVDFRIGRRELGTALGKNVAIFKLYAYGPAFRWHDRVNGQRFHPLSNQHIAVFDEGAISAIQASQSNPHHFPARQPQGHFPCHYINV